MKRISKLSIASLFLFFMIICQFQSNAKATTYTEKSEQQNQVLFEKGAEMELDILDRLPISKTYASDPFVQTVDIEMLKTAYPDIYAGYAVENGELILKLSKTSKSSKNKPYLKIARELAKQHGAKKIRYVNYSLNELHSLYAKANYYIDNGNDCGIIMTGFTGDVVLIGFEKVTESNTQCAKKLLGNSTLLEFVEFTYQDD